VCVGLHYSLSLRPRSTVTLQTLSSQCNCGEWVPPSCGGCGMSLGSVKPPSTPNSSERMVVVAIALMVGAAMLVFLWLPAAAAQLVGARYAGDASPVPSRFDGQTWTLADTTCDSSSLGGALLCLSHQVPPVTTATDGRAHCQGCEHEEETSRNAPVDNHPPQSKGDTWDGAVVAEAGDSSLDEAVDSCTDAAMRCMDTDGTTTDCDQCVEFCDSAFHVVEASDEQVQERQRLTHLLKCHSDQCQGGREPAAMFQ